MVELVVTDMGKGLSFFHSVSSIHFCYLFSLFLEGLRGWHMFLRLHTLKEIILVMKFCFFFFLFLFFFFFGSPDYNRNGPA